MPESLARSILNQARVACCDMGLGQDTDDFVQEAAIKIWLRRERIDTDRSWREQNWYMRRIARHAVIDALRKRTRLESRFVVRALVDERSDDVGPVGYMEAADALRVAMGVRLTPKEAQAVASLFGDRSEGVCRSALCHARRKLKRSLEGMAA